MSFLIFKKYKIEMMKKNQLSINILLLMGHSELFFFYD